MDVSGVFRFFHVFSMVFHGCMPSFSDFFMDFHVLFTFFHGCMSLFSDFFMGYILVQ